MQVIHDNLQVLRIDAPEWFALDAFKEAVERGTAPTADIRIATFHRHGSPFTVYSDIFIPFEAYGALEPDGTTSWIVESSDLLDVPGLEQVYDSIVRLTRELGFSQGILWLSNIGRLRDATHGPSDNIHSPLPSRMTPRSFKCD